MRHFTTAGERLARPSGQTLARWLVPEVIGRAPATVAQVARDLALARQSVQRVADLLEREGLAVYIDNPRHRRAKLLGLTPLGRAALDDIQARQFAWADVLGERIGEQELRHASGILDQVLSVLERSNKSRLRAEVIREDVRPWPRV
jgi:DNA-binding MarR family transcriptional regulator